LEGRLPARTILGKWGPEYRIDNIPDDLVRYVKGYKVEEDTPNQTQLALQMLDSITGEYKAKVQELEATNLNLAIELGKERARREEMENRIKLLPAPKSLPPKSLLSRILGRFVS